MLGDWTLFSRDAYLPAKPVDLCPWKGLATTPTLGFVKLGVTLGLSKAGRSVSVYCVSKILKEAAVIRLRYSFIIWRYFIQCGIRDLDIRARRRPVSPLRIHPSRRQWPDELAHSI